MPNWKKLITSGSSGSLANLEVDNHISASLLSGSFYGDGSNLTGITFDTSSLLTTASAEFSELTFTKGDGSTFPVSTTPRKVIETVKNGESFTLAKGTPVYVSGSGGNSSIVYASSASLSSKMPAAYVLNEELISDEEGEAILSGFINGVNTSIFNEGDSIYVGENGGYTNVKPTGSNLIQKLGNVIKSSINNGSGVITGAGRSNDVPNITPGYVWLGNSGSVATPVSSASLFVDTASFALSSSYTATSSLAIQAISIFPFTSSINNIAIISGSLVITGSALTTGSLESTGSVEFSYDDPGSGAWSLGDPLSTERSNLGGAGTQNAALAFGGYGGYTATEEYNGSSWSTGGNMQCTGQNGAGAGTQNAALAFGFSPYESKTEEYNGISWGFGGDLGCARTKLAGAGTQNAGLAFGGSNVYSYNTEEYNGVSWSDGGNLSSEGRRDLGGAGTQNAALAFGGYGYSSATVEAYTEEYNGTTWSSGGPLSTARFDLGGTGTQNSALAFGGYTGGGLVACTEEYNGATWETGGTLLQGRNQLGGAGGTNESSLAFGGYAGAGTYCVACTEEYSLSPVNRTTFDYSALTGQTTIEDLNVTTLGFNSITNNNTSSVVSFSNPVASDIWAISSPMLNPRNNIGSITSLGARGDSDVQLAAGGTEIGNNLFIADGDPTAFSTFVEGIDYNDNTWKTYPRLNTGRNNPVGAGNAIIGGASNTNNSSEFIRDRQTYVWATGPNITTARVNMAGSGPKALSNEDDRGIIFGGRLASSPYTSLSCTEELNFAATPSAGGSLNIARFGLASADRSSDFASNPFNALAFGGCDAIGSTVSCTEEYSDTTSTWTNRASMNISRGLLSGGGTTPNALAFGGKNSSNSYGTTCTEEYNGSTNTWSTRGNLNFARCSFGGGQIGSKSFAFGGINQYSANVAYAELYCDTTYTKEDFKFDNINAVKSCGNFIGGFKGTLEGSANHSYNSDISVSSSNAATASYVEADSVDYSGLTHYNDDTAAAAGGVPIGGLYRNGNFLVIRLT